MRAFLPIRTSMSRALATLTLPVAAAALTLAACESTAVDEKALTQNAALRTESLLHDTGAAMGFVAADGSTVKTIMGSGSSAADTLMSPTLAASMPPTTMLRAMVGPRATQKMTGVELLPSMMTPEEQFDEVGNQLRRLMEERLFVDSNLEGKDGGTATYLLRPDPTCRPLPDASDPAAPPPAVNADCADTFTKVQVRVAVSSDGDGARFTVLVGPDRMELISVIVHSDELAVQANLPKAKSASDYLRAQLGEEAPVQDYERLAGTVRLSLKKAGAGAVTAAWSIIEKLDIAQKNGPAYSSAAADPLLAVTADGTRRTARLDLGLGATKVDSTWDPRSTGATNRDLHVELGGVYGHFLLDEAAKEIVVTDAGVGQIKVAARTATLMDLNLNADTMRRFSGKLASNADGTTRVEITPKADLTVAFDYNAVASELTSPPDPSVAHETYAVSLTNGGAAAILQEAPSTATFAGGLKVVAGTLTLGIASAPAQTVTVSAGRCLTSRDPAPEGSNPLLGKLVAADCP